MARKIRVLIADDHAVIREGLRVLLSTDPGVEVAGEAGNGDAAVKLARRLHPDVVVMDVAMPRLNGLDATQSILRDRPQSKVLVLSAYNDEESVRRMLSAGAAGYLTKHSAASELLQAIREVVRGNAFFSPRVAKQLRQQSRQAFMTGRSLGTPRRLTGRESQVLRLIASGLGNKQIAGDLKLSVKTVEKHRQAVMLKLDLHDVAALTRYAVACHLVPSSPVEPGGRDLAPDRGVLMQLRNSRSSEPRFN
jgi:DNA-binding NarL/FixJ family response regulator